MPIAPTNLASFMQAGPSSSSPLRDLAARRYKEQQLQAQQARADQLSLQQLAQAQQGTLNQQRGQIMFGQGQRLPQDAGPRITQGYQEAQIKSFDQPSVKDTYDPYKTASIEERLSGEVDKAVAEPMKSVDAFFKFDAVVRGLGASGGERKTFGEMTAPDQLAAIKLFEKTLDPTSIVRESEAAGVANTRGYLDTLFQFKDKIAKGTQLGEDQVRALYGTVRSLAVAQQAIAKHRADRLGPQIENYQKTLQLQPSNVRQYTPRSLPEAIKHF